MRNQKGPGKTVTKIAQLCKDKGIDLVYFNDKNISMKRNKIKGKVWMEEQWNKIEIDVPAIIDISPLCRKHKKKVAYLGSLSNGVGDRLKSFKIHCKLYGVFT